MPSGVDGFDQIPIAQRARGDEVDLPPEQRLEVFPQAEILICRSCFVGPLELDEKVEIAGGGIEVVLAGR